MSGSTIILLFGGLTSFLQTQEIQQVQIPVKYKDEDGNTVVQVEAWPFMDVHAVMSYLMDEAKLEVPPKVVHEYWAKSKQYGEPWAQNVQDFSRIPIGIYGDSATVKTVVGSENVIAIFANIVLWRPKSIRWSRFLLFTIAEERCTADTLLVVYRRLTWGANHAWYGYWPTKGPQGEPLQGHAAKVAGTPLTYKFHRFQVTEIRGDWAWQKKIFRFEKCHWSGDSVCPFCDVKQLSGPWEKKFWNIETNTAVIFDLVGFMAHRMPSRRVCA